MSTEDDTFATLAKPDFASMRALYLDQFPSPTSYDTSQDQEEFLIAHFWTKEEYKEACWVQRYETLRYIAKQCQINIKI